MLSNICFGEVYFGGDINEELEPSEVTNEDINSYSSIVSTDRSLSINEDNIWLKINS